MGKYTIPHTAFYYIRHGETHWNKENRLQGQKDMPLNETGSTLYLLDEPTTGLHPHEVEKLLNIVHPSFVAI